MIVSHCSNPLKGHSLSRVQLKLSRVAPYLEQANGNRPGGRPAGRPWLVLLAAPAIALLIAACGTESAVQPSPDSGIEGQALAGPQCPVVRAGSGCPDLPLKATVDVVKADRSEKTTFDTDENGRFRVSLAPGDYHIEPRPIDPSRPFPAPRSQDVTVPPHEFVQITIQYDTGIR